MLKILVLSFLICHVISVDFFLARNLVLVSNDERVNQLVQISSAKNETNSISKLNQNNSCSEKSETLWVKNPPSKFFFGEDLIVNWKKNLSRDGVRMMGHFSMKYQDNKYREVKYDFTLCHGDEEYVPLGKTIFYRIFIRGYNFYTYCLGAKTVKVGSSFSFQDHGIENIHCDANAVIRINIFEESREGCKASKRCNSNNKSNPFRVVFNAKFENCDGKSSKLSDADKIIKAIANNPIF